MSTLSSECQIIEFLKDFLEINQLIYFSMQGYRSGYVFKIPLVKDEPLKPKSDVELPPAVSSLGYVLEEENLYKDG